VGFSLSLEKERAMVILVLTKHGFQEIEAILGNPNVKCWINQHILSKDKIAEYKSKGIHITDFVYDIDSNSEEQINNALELLHEHHPGEVVFVEH
jgi:hypothetical protein